MVMPMSLIDVGVLNAMVRLVVMATCIGSIAMVMIMFAGYVQCVCEYAFLLSLAFH